MERGCTLFIYLLKDDDGRARYFASAVGRDLRDVPLAPSEMTPEISVTRDHILDKVGQFAALRKDKEEFKREIGYLIAENLGLNKFLRNLLHLTDKSREITLLTNDVEIPWEWAYFAEEDCFFAQAYDYGKILPEKALPARLASTSLAARDPKASLASKHAILLYDDYDGATKWKPKLPWVLQEISDLASLLEDCGIPKENIHSVYGGNPGAELTFNRLLTKHGKELLLVHFAGHLVKAGLALSDRDSTIESREVSDLLVGKRLGGTLVFLNACLSGEIREVWDTEQNMSTAFLAAGASGCVCTLESIPDRGAAQFAMEFYTLVLRDDIGLTIAEALRKTRMGVHGMSEIDTLLWTLYGYPDVVLLSEELRL